MVSLCTQALRQQSSRVILDLCALKLSETQSKEGQGLFAITAGRRTTGASASYAGGPQGERGARGALLKALQALAEELLGEQGRPSGDVSVELSRGACFQMGIILASYLDMNRTGIGGQIPVEWTNPHPIPRPITTVGCTLDLSASV